MCVGVLSVEENVLKLWFRDLLRDTYMEMTVHSKPT